MTEPVSELVERLRACSAELDDMPSNYDERCYRLDSAVFACDTAADRLTQLQAELAASQEREGRLREALRTAESWLDGSSEECLDFDVMIDGALQAIEDALGETQ